jgi:hypothetical protein
MRNFFRQNLQRKRKHIFLYPITFFPKIVPFEIMSKNVVKPEKPQTASLHDANALPLWMLDKPTTTHARAHAYAPGHPHTRSFAYTRARTDRDKYNNTDCFSTAVTIRERAPMLRYTYIACLVNVCIICLQWCTYNSSNSVQSLTNLETCSLTSILIYLFFLLLYVYLICLYCLMLYPIRFSAFHGFTECMKNEWING